MQVIINWITNYFSLRDLLACVLFRMKTDGSAPL